MIPGNANLCIVLHGGNRYVIAVVLLSCATCISHMLAVCVW